MIFFSENKKCPACFSDHIDLRLRVFIRIDYWSTSNRGLFLSFRGNKCLSCGYNISI